MSGRYKETGEKRTHIDYAHLLDLRNVAIRKNYAGEPISIGGKGLGSREVRKTGSGINREREWGHSRKETGARKGMKLTKHGLVRKIRRQALSSV